MPLSPSFAATSLGTGTRVPPPPLGVAVSTPLNLITRAILARSRVGTGRVIDEARSRLEKAADVVVRVTKRGGSRVELSRRELCLVPSALIESVDDHHDGRNRLCGGERAVARPVNEELAQQVLLAGGLDRARVSGLVLRD